MEVQNSGSAQAGGYPAARKASLVAKGAVAGSAATLLLASAAKLALRPAAPLGEILHLLVLFSAFGFSLASWMGFLLDSMCSLLGLTQARPARLALAFGLALLSLVPLAIVIAGARLEAGVGR